MCNLAAILFKKGEIAFNIHPKKMPNQKNNSSAKAFSGNPA